MTIKLFYNNRWIEKYSTDNEPLVTGICSIPSDDKKHEIEYLFFHCDFDEFQSDVSTIISFMDHYKNIQNDSFLNIEFIDTLEEKQFQIFTKLPYEMTIETYLKSEKRSQIEIEYQLINIVDLFTQMIENEMNINCSLSDMSLVLVRKERSPFPIVCVSPYAFLNSFVKLEMKEKLSLQKSFIHIFKEYKSLLSQFYNDEHLFDDIIECLSKRKIGKQKKEIIQIIENNYYLKEIMKKKEIPSYSIHDYEIVEEIGNGSFGQIFKVVKNETQTIDSNIKESLKGDEIKEYFVIKTSRNKYSAESIRREAVILHHLKHPNIVQFLGFTETRIDPLQKISTSHRMPCLLMEHCQCDLYDYLHRNYFINKQKIPIAIIENIVGQIVSGCLFIHSKRIVHRDIKLENMLVKQQFPYLLIKLTDFGGSRSTNKVMYTVQGTRTCVHLNVLNGNGYKDTVDLYSIGGCF